MRTILLIFILFLVYLFNRKHENFEDNYLIPSNGVLDLEEGENVDINISNDYYRNLIKKMKNMVNYIDDPVNNTSDIFNMSEDNLTKKNMILVLYETLIDDFLDRYLKFRFNIHNYMIVLYKYPDDTNEAYDNIYIKYLKPTVNYLFKNVQSNSLTEDYFDFSFDNKQLRKYNLDKIIKTLSSEPNKDTIKALLNNVIKNYLNAIFNKLNLKLCENNELPCYNSDNFPFTYKPKIIDNDNYISVIESIEEMLFHEQYLLENL